MGLNFDYMSIGHSEEVNGATLDYSFSLPSIGLIARFGGVDPGVKTDSMGWGVSTWVNYMFGSGKSEYPAVGGVLTNTSDYNGVQLGGNILFQFRIPSTGLILEAGPYLSYNIADFEIEAQSTDTAGNRITTTTEIDAGSLQFGLTFQGTFQIGL